MTTKYSLPSSGIYPWLAAPYSFVGWVPNVSGHLSFGLICPNGESLALNRQPGGSGERAIVVHRRRSAEDFPLPGSWVGLVRRSATLDYVVAARTSAAQTPLFIADKLEERTEANGVLTGVILAIPRDTDSETSELRDAFLSNIDAAIGAAVAGKTEADEERADGLPEWVRDQAVLAQRQIACHRVNFAMFRTGELRLWFDLDEFLGRDTAIVPATDPEKLAAEYLPSQMYFCLKDLTHRHYHHDPQTDQLLDLHRVDTSGNVAEDVEWRIDTLRGLAKVVVEFRHSNVPTSNKKALGVLAYANAFQSLLARIERGNAVGDAMRPQSKVILYDFAHVRSSIEALDALNESRRGALLQLFGIIVGVILSAFALWAGAVQIQPILCDAMRATTTPCPKITPNTAVDLINLVVANPLGFVALLTVLGFAAFIGFFKGVTSVPGAKPIRIWVSRFSSALATSLSQRLGGKDDIGFAAHLGIIGLLTVGAGATAFWLIPKTEVPSVADANRGASGPWSSLGKLVGKKPADSGLFTSSVIAPTLRDLAGSDYDSFMALMSDSTALQGRGVLYVTGKADGGTSRDAAYLLIDQANQKLEIGLRRSGGQSVYRSPGAAIPKPAAITQTFDGISADISPLAVLAPACRNTPNGRTVIFEGMLPADDHCEYRIPLRAGQIFQYSATSARGLQVSIGVAGSQIQPINLSYRAKVDGDYVVRVSWQTVGGTPSERAQLRRFYVRSRIQ